MLDKVIKLLAYLNDKDLFAEFYRKRLSRRLLQDRIVEHHEMQVLAQLKAQCGAQFTGKVRLPRPGCCRHLTSQTPPARCQLAARRSTLRTPIQLLACRPSWRLLAAAPALACRITLVCHVSQPLFATYLSP